jgi:hypothetical protein
MFNILSHKGNSNQNDTDISFQHKMALTKKTNNNKFWQEIGGRYVGGL